MVQSEIANIRVCLDSHTNATAYISVNGAVIEKNPQIKELVTETAEELAKKIFELMDFKVIVGNYTDD